MNLQMMDLAKLKVVDLRGELSKRGLDTKGNKPVLIERLRKALEQETGDPSPAAEVTAVETPEENVSDTAQREQTPDPTTPNKTSGRSSRSASATTPTKITPTRGSPKILLTPLSEKQITPSKSPITEKAEKTSPLKKEAPPDEAKEPEKQENEAKEQTEISEEASKLENEITETAEESSLKEEPETEKTAMDSEEKPALEKDDTEESKNAEEDSSVIAKESDDTNEESPDTGMAEKDDESEEQSKSEIIAKAQDTDEEKLLREEEKLLQDEEMETNDDNGEGNQSADATNVKAEIDEDDENVENVEKGDGNTAEDSNADETTEDKADVEMKHETDVKPIVDEAQKQNEEPDIEMKEVKEEPEEDSERDSKDRDRKDRKDRKRKRSSSPQEDRHRSPQPSHTDDEPDLKEAEVVLSWYDSDLNLIINKESFLSATAMHNDGFGYIWAGARATYGFTEGKVYYEAKITECCDVNLENEVSPHVLRVGWSVQGTSMQLGEEPLTYGYGGTGKISSANKFADYGTPYGKDDVVGCYLDLSSDTQVVISYTVNGKSMGAAFTIEKSELDGKALFPHVLTKNCTFVCNFGQEKPWCEEILEGYTPTGIVELKDRVCGPRRPEKREECEMIMMCGLPSAGKTVWATKYAENNRDKMYNVLGTNSLIEKMKVVGLPRRRNYHGRWEVLIDKCTKCLNKLLDMASSRRRNYILDQTNVYPSAQRRKMRNFYGYQRRAIVIVPTDEEFKARTAKRSASEGEVAPETAVLEMKANFSAPVVGESFDSVEYVELPEEEAKKLIEKYNKEGKDAGYGQQQASKRPRFERSDNHRESRDSRQNSRDSRDSRDHRDRRNNYQDRNRNSTWRGGSSSGGGGGGGWRDRQARPTGHIRHGGGGSGGGGSYGGAPSGGGGWRGRGGPGGPPSSYRPSNDRRGAVHDRRTSGNDRNRSVSTRQGGWGPMNSYQNSQQSGGWGGSQSGNWSSGGSQQQGSWGGQQGWGQQQPQQQQQQWGNWKGYGQGNYSQANYNQQGYGNGNWGSWNQQYYNQYWGQQQPTGQTSAAGSQAATTGSATAGNSTTSTGSTYSSYSPGWQGYTQSYSFPAESSNTNAQQQK